MSRPAPTARRPGIALEASLVSVHVVVALAFARLFEGTGFVRPLLGYVLGAHALAIATRRARLPGLVAIVLAALGGALATTWILFPDTATWGLPTSATWTAAGDALAEARVAYPEVIAPTEAIPGFLLAAGLALWIAAWFADWTAHRLRAGAEAVAPAAAVFTFGAVLGSGAHEVAAAVAFAASTLAFLGLQRAEALARDQAWSPEQRPAARSLARSAAALGALAVLIGASVGPALPGAGAEGTLDWRGDGDGNRSRVTVSPMVELRRRLVDQSDVEVFRVTSDERAYWRLTSLDRFDGEIWSSDGEFRPADEELPSRTPDAVGGAAVVQSIEIEALAAIWAPAAFEPVSVRSSDEPLRWDPDSSTLIVDSEVPTSDGLTYTVVSRAPTFDPAALAAAGRRDPPEIAERYELLPADFPELAAERARQVTAGARTRYDQALALQEHFRTTYEYSLSVPAGHGDDALVQFLDERVGYCEQFAGAYAAMARSLGIPARVAVGFTPGEQDARDPDVSIVRGRHAHAWPELYFPTIGWVPFEPTPGRGIPGGEAHTGVAADQDDRRGGDPSASTTTTAEATSTTEAGAPSTSAGDADLPERSEITAATPATEGGDDDRRPLGAVVALVALAAAAGVVAWRRRGRRTAVEPTGPADAAWRAVAAALAAGGSVAEPSETPLEVAARVGAERPGLAAELQELAELVTEERWSATAPGAAHAERAVQLRDDLLRELAERRPVAAGAS